MRPVNVVQLVASSRGGGAVHVRDLVSGLDAGDFAPQVAMPEDGGNVRPEDFFIPFHRVDIAAGLSLEALRRIRSLVAGVDILHVHGARAALFGRLAVLSLGKRRPRVVYTIHGFAAPHYAPPRRQILLFVEHWLARVTDAWICVSHAEKAALLATHAAESTRVQVIHNGIDLSRFVGAAVMRGKARQALNLPEHAFVITTVCRLNRPRDLTTLVSAFRSVQNDLQHAHLIIVGDGPLRPQLERRVRSLAQHDHVHLLGMRRDVPHILAATDVFALSSRGWEGLPLTVLEAMASALPVVASDVGGTGEAVVREQTGYLFPAGDAAALADCLRTLARDEVLAHQLGQRGLARVRELFTVQRMVRQTAALYDQLLD